MIIHGIEVTKEKIMCNLFGNSTLVWLIDEVAKNIDLGKGNYEENRYLIKIMENQVNFQGEQEALEIKYHARLDEIDRSYQFRLKNKGKI